MQRPAELTRVLPKRQKLMGLKDKAGKLAKDESQLADLKLKPGAAIMMLGAQEEAIDAAASSSASGGGDIVDDLQMQEELFEELEPHKDPIVLVRFVRCMRCAQNRSRCARPLLGRRGLRPVLDSLSVSRRSSSGGYKR